MIPLPTMNIFPRLVVAAVAFVFAAGFFPNLGAAPAVVALPDDRPGSTVILLGVEMVRDDLSLSSRQRSALDAIRKEYRVAARKVVAGAGESVDSKEAAQKQLDAVTDRFDARAIATLTPSQKSRLTQIEHQLLGGHMLLSPGVQRQLGLTANQKSRLASIHAREQRRVAKINGWYENGEVGNYERLLYLRQSRLAQSEAMIEVLTSEQRTALSALEGEDFFKTAS